MRLIYQNAALVIAWLGIGDESGMLAIAKIARLADEVGKPTEMPAEAVGTPVGYMTQISGGSYMRSSLSLKKQDAQLKDLFLKFDEKDLTCSMRVLNADFWRRLWVIQGS